MEKTNFSIAKEKDLGGQRQSNFELLRIIAMLLIVLYHLNSYAVAAPTSTFNVIAYNFFGLGGMIGNNLFILISSYFLIGRKTKLKQFTSVISQTLFYAVICSLVSLIILNFNVNIEQFDFYWFVMAYLIFLLAVPVLNVLVENMTKKMHFYFIIGIIAFTCILTFILGEFNLKSNFTNRTLWFMELFIIIGFFKKYNINIKKWILVITLIISLTLQVVISLYVYKGNWYLPSTLLCFVTSLLLFLLFKNWNIKSKVINTTASTTFGVYLIHENYFVRYAYSNLLIPMDFGNSDYFVPILLGLTLAVFTICVLIDLARQYLIHKPIERLYNKKKK